MRTRWVAGLCLSLLVGCAHHGATTEPPDERVAAWAQATTAEQNLIAFARLYGYVRFFHPTEASDKADWQRLAIYGVQQIEGATTNEQLAQRLEDVFRPLAPSLQLWADGEAAPAAPTVPTRRDGLVYWQYQGFPGTPVSLYTPPYSKVRVQSDESWRRHFSAAPPAGSRVETEIAPGLHMRLPVVLSADDAQQVYRAPRVPLADVDPNRDVERAEVRLAAVIEVWNVLRHFYPYQQELELDWTAMLEAGLRSAQSDRDAADFRNTLRGLLEPLEDGHGFVGNVRMDQGTLPVRIELVEDQAVVTGTRDPDHFSVGDVITSIGGTSARDRIAQISERLSGTPQWRNFRAAAWELSRAGFGQEVAVRLERNGTEHEVIAEAERAETPQPPRPPTFHTFDDGVEYVDLTRADWSEIKTIVPRLAAAPGVVFDLRGYPVHNDTILDHLLDEPEDTLWMHVPRFVEPDGQVVGWRDLGWHRRPAAPHIEAPVTFLISAEAISYAESMLSYVEAHDLGTLVGTTTAGANGDIVRFDTVGGFFVVFSGMRVTRHDGSPFHRGGVEPDIEVRRTIAGLRAGRDEVLQAGLDVVREKMSPRQARRAKKRRRRTRTARQTGYSRAG